MCMHLGHQTHPHCHELLKNQALWCLLCVLLHIVWCVFDNNTQKLKSDEKRGRPRSIRGIVSTPYILFLLCVICIQDCIQK